MSDHHDPLAGDFSTWMKDVQAAIRGKGESEVPCGSCAACCTASQFIHIGPDETDTLANIRAGVLFPAPRLPQGHVLMGYDQRGHCPMLIEGKCSIYAHRPTDLPHLRLSSLSSGGNRTRRRQAAHRRTGEPLELQLSHRLRPHSTRCCSRLGVVPPRT